MTEPLDVPPILDAPRPRSPRPVRLGDLAERLGTPLRAAQDGTAAGAPSTAPGERTVTGITLDSRAVRPGDLWCALPGVRAHGAQFAAQARERGAVAALSDDAGAALCAAAGLPALVAPDPRAATAPAAVLIAGEPASHLRTVGVTGTNGKTSVTTMLTGTLDELGRPAGVIGTSGTRFHDAAGRAHEVRTERTTPEAPDVQGILALMVQDGVASVAMEVSSHAMVLHRADGIRFDAACFTGLSQDHLDFHGDMEHYYAAKASLFTPAHAVRGIVCTDGPWGRRLAAEATVPVSTYAVLAEEEGYADADARAEDLRPEGLGTRFRLARRGAADVELISPLPGRHYVANTVAVALLLEQLGIEIPAAAPAIARAAVVPGRMEQVAEAPVRGIVDFSHTEDALVQALTTLRAVPGVRRVIAVIGAGGDRDRSKRPRMGAAAARLADVVVVTDDNPRSEDPAAIRAAVLAGIPADAPAEVHEVPGRAEAIALAARLAADQDLVLVAGKGSERGQDIGGIVHPFDDRAQLRAALADRAAPRPAHSSQEDPR